MSPAATKIPPEDDFWAIVPAAGAGERMKSGIPKQYLSIHGKTVLEHALSRFFDIPAIRGVLVCIAADDVYWRTLGIEHPKLLGTVIGGMTRAESVMNGLRALEQHAGQADWVLVHDAVRPCVKVDDINSLMRAASEDIGGLLAVPVLDTIKRADKSGCVANTVDRDGLWHAQTPQLFRLGTLQRAIHQAMVDHIQVTDEAQAVERLGCRPKLVPGSRENIKITEPADLALAEQLLRPEKTNLRQA